MKENTGDGDLTGAGDLAQVYSSCGAACRNSEAIRMAHVRAHILDSATKCRDRIQGNAGITSAFHPCDQRWMFTRRQLLRQSMWRRLLCCHWSFRPERKEVRSRQGRKLLPHSPIKKGTKRARNAPFSRPSMVSSEITEIFWNEWRGRRDSNPRPLP